MIEVRNLLRLSISYQRALGLGAVFTKTVDDVKGLSTINARVESITKAPTWREPMKKRRCIIPANAFYEGVQPESRPDRLRPMSTYGWDTDHIPTGKERLVLRNAILASQTACFKGHAEPTPSCAAEEYLRLFDRKKALALHALTGRFSFQL